MHLPNPKILHDAAVAPADGVVLYDPEWRLNDRNNRDEVTLEVVEGPTPTYSIQCKQSADGTTYFDIGAAITTPGLTTVANINLPYFKAVISSVSGGDLTITAV